MLPVPVADPSDLGWTPGETVTFQFHEYSGPYTDMHPSVTSVADTAGNVVNTTFAPDSHDVDVLFILTATGGISHLQAQAKFLKLVAGRESEQG